MQRENKVNISDPYEDGELKEIKTNTITRKNKWQYRFDEEYEIESIGDYSEQLIPNSMEKSPIKSFIQSEIDLAVAEERNKAREIIKKEFEAFNNQLNNL